MRVEQAAGGTNRPGIPASLFAISPGQRIRYDVPHPALADCVTGYATYISDARTPMFNWYLPAPAMIVILLDAGTVAVRFRNAVLPETDPASVWGPTSHAFRTTTHGGISVGIGLTAEGWARLTASRAADHRDRVTPLAAFVSPAVIAEIVAALDALDDDAGIGPLLDRMLPSLFAPPPAEAATIRALSRFILTDGAPAVADAVAQLARDPRTLRRLATDHFGMPVKPLLLRARFIRSFARWMLAGEPASYDGIDPSYFDMSHFLRDAGTYLGMTPRRFAKLEIDYLRASLRARAAVLGAAQHTLQPAGRDADAT